ncbi:MAG: NAD(P)-dependent oxidoreductase [Thiothrix sp.]|nr:MAG: NAD(P)-dependent oxidoreductase [Thiothrix sp.]
MLASLQNGICSERLALSAYQENFADAHPPLTATQAQIEAERCYYCYAAPCQTACPTGIDIPSFIARIAQGNPRGAAAKILEENVLGGMCARVCPTEVLCEQACVRNTNEDKPVEIGLLQRFATDDFFANPQPPLFIRAADTGKKIAVVGSGPAGLSCAHRLACLGHQVTIFEARAKLGGLNEYGLAAYKTPNNFAQQEIEWLLSIGGIAVKTNTRLGQDIFFTDLVSTYDAVFLGLGLSGVNALGISEPETLGLRNAVEFISDLRQAEDLSQLPVGRKVVVIGGGMTAIDAAVQSRKLGAEEVTIVYRRGQEGMSASDYEQEWAKNNGVTIRHWAAPLELLTSEDGQLTGIRFAYTQLEEGRLKQLSESFELAADMVLRAIGQNFDSNHGVEGLAMQSGKILTDENGKTNVAKVWAGGDCRFGGKDLTVEGVQHGKLSALDIHRSLSQAA